MQNESELTLIAHTLYAKADPKFGFIKPIAIQEDGGWSKITTENFCQTGKVFITRSYDDLEKNYKMGELFRIRCSPTAYLSEHTDPNNQCKYISFADRAERLKPKDFIEIVDAELPDVNDRSLLVHAHMPGTQYIMVRDSIGTLFGPFNWKQDDDDEERVILSLLTTNLGWQLPQYHVYEIPEEAYKDQILTLDVEQGSRSFLCSVSILKTAKAKDYANDTEVIRFCTSLASTLKTTPIEKTKISNLEMLALKGAKNPQLYKGRFNRFRELASRAEISYDLLNDGFTDLIKLPAGQAAIQVYIEENRPKFVDGIRREVEGELLKEMTEKRLKLDELDNRLANLQQDIKQANVELQRTKEKAVNEEELAKARADKSQELTETQKKIDDFNAEINKLAETHGTLLNIDAMQKKQTSLQVMIEHYGERKRDIESAIKDLQLELDQDDDKLRKRIMELKPYVEAFNGAYHGDTLVLPNLGVTVVPLDMEESLFEKQRTVLDAVGAGLRVKGRWLADDQVANLLICLQQSFITFLAGMPGVGKTSLAHLLTGTLGEHNRLHKVAVARGWTSLKDLIGFFNALSGRFQPANTGLAQFLKALDDESAVLAENTAMAYVLLDEANLSPIEHYWSDFMAMADGESPRVLRMGRDECRVSNNMRFLATINYDGTTEPLSPRVIDRAPIIVMESSALIAPVEVESIVGRLPISARAMEDLFGKSVELPDLAPDEAQVFDSIRNVLAQVDNKLGRPVHLSPRKENAIRHYCAKARDLMRDQDELLALDYAIKQHVLPQVRGHGKPFEKRLQEVLAILAEAHLDGSHAMLTRMIAYGAEDLNSYDFFCW